MKLGLTLPRVARAPEDGGSAANGASGGNGSPTPSTTSTQPPPPDWASFSRSMDKMRDDIVGAVGGLHQTVATASTPPEREPEPVDFESMSRADLVAFTVGQVMAAVEEKFGEQLAPIVGAVNELRTGNVTQTVTADIEKLKADPASDFDEWKGDMAQLAQAHPTLGINDLYALARGKNPDKARQLSEKRSPPPAARPRWGGLAPNGLNRYEQANQGEKLTSREATAAALDEVLTRNPALEQLLAS